ncbi:hypothetical protein [Bythopirellula polymerisocia]|uniref:Uncharacterized protein n=1 Tax=Bythopirellula polymerisocia TaxID=2528003 RepID=A0A5C6CL75_9BACT|nr:hypothetical protein [Bythopirellula polymerisocia]TWU23579.1 hypothetical protein Pla144_37540 [Bythopirellula polymerisocia]
MSRLIVYLSLLMTIDSLLTSQVEGQIIRRLRERRAAAQAPVAAPGDPAAAPIAPLPRLRGLLARRLQAQQDLVAQEEVQPTPASPDQKKPETPASKLAARRAASGLRQVTAMQSPAIPKFTLSDLDKMDVNGLQSALANVDGALQNELNRFSSAESWQGFLDLPAEVVDEEAVNPEALEVSLDRFNRVANNPAFSQISSLASFAQTRGILAELANRTVGPQLGSATDSAVSTEATSTNKSAPEQLPAPQPSPVQARVNKGERSILVRSE